MKRFFKIIILMVMLIIITGCSGNYNVEIKKDMSVSEDLYLTYQNENDAYSKTLKIFKDNKVPEKNYSVVINNNNVIVTYNNSYDSIEEYITESKVYKQLFDEIQFNKTDKYIDIYASQYLKLKNSYINNFGTNLNDIDILQINITNPFKVDITNAEISNNNTYTWALKSGDVEKKIEMQFKPTLNTFPYKQTIVLISVIVCTFIIMFTIYRRFKQRQKI